MIKTFGRFALLTSLAVLLAGCISQQPAPVEQAGGGGQQPVQPQPQPTQPVPTVPSVPTLPQQPGPIEHQDQTGQPAPRERHYDWNTAVQPMVGKMLQASGATAGSVLLVDSVNNRTNGSANTGEATDVVDRKSVGRERV